MSDAPPARVVTILFFGSLAERHGRETRMAVGEGLTTGALSRMLDLDDPQVRVSVDHRIVGHDHVLAGGEEVAFLPIVSGG